MNTLLQQQELFIEATRLYPGAEFKNNGELSITGRIISDHLNKFFSPLFEWVEACHCPHIQLDINLDYLNSNGTFLLRDLLRKMEDNPEIKTIRVLWHCEDEDEGHYELGEIIREKLTRAEFKYISYL